MQIGENGIEMIGMYARNGREAINLVQISAGMAINEERSFIKDEDIEWVVHSSQLTPKYEKRIYPIHWSCKWSCCIQIKYRCVIRN